MENKETFKITYSAKEQEEIKAIRDKYAPEEVKEDKMTQLRRLDEGVTKKASTVSLVIGIIGALIMGSGMSLAMTELAAILGQYEDMAMIIGISIGVVGIILICAAYPVYNRIVKTERKKIAPEILRITDELMK